ncbi:hypothetical protein P280DRAFT_245194 [Massarina eburnea CBS 473.64]|uniref:F-box domain-containing protein n=1 Tax=Massarina eburnea CBS 473.64 TaxID=1395130 RepID=A0A6A6S856_9PLEO|nr:hypothetical protein P280DRAFT_245194 [Massarina eburnea CBS 473.64]
MSVTSIATTMPQVIKIEDSPEPMVHTPAIPHPASNTATAQPTDPNDPEAFLRRCSGYNKKKGVRCSAIIGRNSYHTKNSHPTYLPTCHAHKDQQSYAGWCQFMQTDGERCGRLFRWQPPYFELCTEHQGHPDTPCYFMALPLELRLEVFRYLLPTRPIGSSTSLVHLAEVEDAPGWFCVYTPTTGSSPALRPRIVRKGDQVSSPVERSTTKSVFSMPLINTLLVNRQICAEVKDLLYSTVPFIIDVRKDGTFMCGRRLLEPRRADGSSHFVANEVDRLKQDFLNTFDFAAVKNYSVDILVENWKDDTGRSFHPAPWDEEVELYDIRDYVGVVVSGILAKSRNLCKLNVRLGLSKFTWDEKQLIDNLKTIVGPFERLRKVRQPRLRGVYDSTPHTNFMISLPLCLQPHVRTNPDQPATRPATPLCSVPQLPTQKLLEACNGSAFGEYRSNWERWVASTSSTTLVHKPPIRAMFTEFKDFYTKLSIIIPDVTARIGKHAFLHRARVAREQEDIDRFRLLRDELIEYWYAYLEQEEMKREDINRRLSKMLDVDVYPSTADELFHRPRQSPKSGPSSARSSVESPLVLDMDTMSKEGIPVHGNVESLVSYHEVRLQMQMESLQRTMPTQRAAIQNLPAAVLQEAQTRQTMALNPMRNSQLYSQTQRNPQQHSQTQWQLMMFRRQAILSRNAAQQQSLTLPIIPQQQRQTIDADWDANANNTQQAMASSSSSSSANQSPTSVNPPQHWNTVNVQSTPPSSHVDQTVAFAVPQYSDSTLSTPKDIAYETSIFQQQDPAVNISAEQQPQSRKRSSVDMLKEDEEVKRLKTQDRANSGLGTNSWIDDDRREFNENGDELMVVTANDDIDVFRGWAGCGDVKGKGKGKAKAVVKTEQEQVGGEQAIWICD